MRLIVGAACALLPLLAGCLVVPTLEHSEAKPDVRCVVGDAKSQKPIHPGVSRQQVLGLLREPQVQSEDGSMVLYRRVMSRGYGIILPPLYPASGPLEQRMYYLRLNFDGDTLDGYELSRDADFQDTNFGYMLLGFGPPEYGRLAGDELVSRAP